MLLVVRKGRNDWGCIWFYKLVIQMFEIKFNHSNKGAKIKLMQTEVRNKAKPSFLDDSDQEALQLFNNLCPNQQYPQQPQSNHPPSMDEDENRPLGRLSKLKKQSKKLKKKLKKKERRMQKQRKMKQLMERGQGQPATPTKTKKIKRKPKGSQSEAVSNQQAGSSEFSSQSQNQGDMQSQLRNLNPDAEQEPTPKRLKKSNRKSKIQNKQGFSIDELGNQAQAKTQKHKKYYDDQDYSFDDVNKKGRKRKPKVSVPTNEEIMSNLKEHGGVVEDEGPQVQGNYDNGLDMLYAMKDKRKGAIKINNKLFSNIDIDIRNQQAQMPPPENLQLELKPKISNHSSSRFTFLSKVETLKKQRGLEANIDVQAYEKKIQERAKQSLAKAVNVMSQQQFHDQIDLQVRVPTIARGKSADIINNTVFLKSFVRNKSDIPQSPIKPPKHIKPQYKKQGISRQQFYRQIQEQTRIRRSKNISEEQLKNSFKKTDLGQLEQARKRIQQKRRKQALSQNSQSQQNGEQQKEDKIEEMIQMEQRICAGIEQQEVGSEGHKEEQVEKIENKLSQANFTINIQQMDGNNLEQQSQNNQEQENEFDELKSASQHPQQAGLEEDEQEQDPEQQQGQQQSQQPNQVQEAHQPMEIEVAQLGEEHRKKMMELQEQGIMMRKKKIGETQPSILASPQEQQPSVPKGKQLAQEQNEQFSNFRKLRKIAMVIANKKKIRQEGRKYASQFIEQQAQEGSDNEEHDDLVKNIDYKAQQKEYEGVDLDADLVELIDNAVDINQQDQYEAFRKYLQDIRVKDREEIKKIIRGEFRSRQDDFELEVEEDERKRQERMEEVMNWMKKREEEEGEGIYLKPPEQDQKSNHDSDSEMSYQKHKDQPVEEQSQQIPQEQEKAMIQRFIENTMPSAKKQYRPVKTIDLGPLPQSVKLQKSKSNKTISLSKLGSKSSEQVKPTKVKKTSSLINQILNRTTISRVSQKTFAGGKLARK